MYLRGLSKLYFRFPQNVTEQRLLNSRYPMQKLTVAQTAKFPLVNEVTELHRLRHFCHFCAAPSMRSNSSTNHKGQDPTAEQDAAVPQPFWSNRCLKSISRSAVALFKITLIRGQLRRNSLQHLNLKYLTRHINI